VRRIVVFVFVRASGRSGNRNLRNLHTSEVFSHDGSRVIFRIICFSFSHSAVSMTSIGAPALEHITLGSRAEKETTIFGLAAALEELFSEKDDKKQSLSSKKSTSSKEMAAAEEATNRIFELAAEMQPPWTAEIVERAEDARHARVAVHVHPPASTATLTVVAQVSVGSGKLRYLKWPGALRLKKVSRTEGACSVAELSDAFAEAFLSGFGTRVGEHGSMAASLSSPRQPPPSSQAAARVRPIPDGADPGARPPSRRGHGSRRRTTPQQLQADQSKPRPGMGLFL
jgi:hypothetical protein